MDSLVPLYVLMILFSTAFVSFKIGSNYAYENKNTRVEYRFIPRSQKELLEEDTNASEVLKNFL